MVALNGAPEVPAGPAPGGRAQTSATLLTLTASVGTIGYLATRLGALPDDLVTRIEVLPMLVFALAAGLISGAVLRYAAGRPGAQEVALAMALLSLGTALAVVPWGEASVLHRAAFGVVWALMFLQFLRFWTRFPTRMTPDATAALRTVQVQTRTGRFLARAAGVAHWAIWTWSGRAVLVAGAIGMSWAIVGVRSLPYNLLLPEVQGAVGLVANLALLGTLVAITLNAVIILTAYRLADEAGRRRVLWMVLAHLVTTLYIVFVICIDIAGRTTGQAFFFDVEGALNTIYLPVTNTMFLGGYAVGIFYSGAFDIRPLIGRSTVYGGLLMSITLVFAAVEEVAEEVLVSRAGLPEGAGTLIGAAAVAVLLGPIRDRLEVWLQRVTGWSPESAGGRTRAQRKEARE